MHELFADVDENQLINCKNIPQNKASIDSKNGILNFPVEKRWLNGEEYAFLLRHYQTYNHLYPKDILLSEECHPDAVYEQPKSKVSNF